MDGCTISMMILTSMDNIIQVHFGNKRRRQKQVVYLTYTIYVVIVVAVVNSLLLRKLPWSIIFSTCVIFIFFFVSSAISSVMWSGFSPLANLSHIDMNRLSMSAAYCLQLNS